MGQTSNYKWKQPETWERAGHRAYGETLSAIDTAVAAKADSSSVNSRFATVNSRLTKLEGRVEAVLGTYTGDGAESRTISLGFTPKAVLVEDSGGMRVANGGSRHGGLALPDAPVLSAGNNIALQIVTGGFKVGYLPGYVDTNTNGNLYRYLAFQ